MIQIPKPQTVTESEGHYTVNYGPAVLEDDPGFVRSVGRTIANMAEAERHLEGIFKSVCEGDSRVLTALLATFRGHKQLLGAIETALSSGQQQENLLTFQAFRRSLHDIWQIRDDFAHGIWARSSDYPNAALRISARVLGRVEQDARVHFENGDFEQAFATYRSHDAEIWTAAEFLQAVEASEGAVNSLMAFSACISRSPVEADHLHTALRNQGLLSDPPWKLQSPTPPQETDDKH